MSAYKIISAVIPERVDDSSSDRYLVVAPEDRIVWVATDEPQDLSPEGRKQAVHDAGLLSLLNKMKREENAVESDRCTGPDASTGLYEDDFSSYVLTEDEYEDETGEFELEEAWEKEKH